MMSLAQLHYRNAEAAAIAAAEDRRPFVVTIEDIESWRVAIERGLDFQFPFPDLGDYVPDGWELTEELFVDATGFDMHDAGGPALSIAEMVERLEPGKGYAITEVGEFQLYLGKFETTR